LVDEVKSPHVQTCPCLFSRTRCTVQRAARIQEASYRAWEWVCRAFAVKKMFLKIFAGNGAGWCVFLPLHYDIVQAVTGQLAVCQLADCQLADWTTRGLDISRTRQLAYCGQVADWTTGGCHRDFACLVFVLLAASVRPRVVQSASWQSASWRIRELSSYIPVLSRMAMGLYSLSCEKMFLKIFAGNGAGWCVFLPLHYDIVQAVNELSLVRS